MKKFILLTFYIAISLFLFAQQNKTAEIELNAKEDIKSIRKIGNNGVLLKTGVSYTKQESNIKYYYLNDDLELKWYLELPKQSSKINDIILSDKQNNATYIINENKTTNEYRITKMSFEGIKTESSFEPTNDFEKSQLIAVTIVNNELTFLKLEMFDSANLSNTRVAIFKHNFINKTIQKTPTEIVFTSDNKASDLSCLFLGFKNNNFLFGKKIIDISTKSIDFSIFHVNEKGTIVKINDIKTTLNAKPVANANYYLNSTDYINNNDYSIKEQKQNGVYVPIVTVNFSSYGGHYYDIENNFLYLYGTSIIQDIKRKKKKEELSENEIGNQFYLIKIDANTGKELFKLENNLPKQIITDKQWQSALSFRYRLLNIDFLNNKILLHFLGGKKLSIIQVNPSDQLFTLTQKEIRPIKYPLLDDYVRYANVSAIESNISKTGAAFLKKHRDLRSKDYSLFAITNNEKCFFIKNYALSKKPKIELFRF